MDRRETERRRCGTICLSGSRKFWMTEESSRRDAALLRLTRGFTLRVREYQDLPICHPDRSRSDDRSEASGGIPILSPAPCRLREFSRESIFLTAPAKETAANLANKHESRN